MKMQWSNVTHEPDRLGESPFWHPGEEALYWVDIAARRIKRLTRDGQPQTWEMPSEPGCIAPVETGGYVIALRDGIYRAPSWGGTLARVARFNHDPATTRFNDGKADPEGRFWAGTIYEPKDARKAELFCVDLRTVGIDGEPLVQLKAQNATTSNGLAWSPDGLTMYWADTPTHAICCWDRDPATNALRHFRVFRQFEAKPTGWTPGQSGYGGRPDGAAVDVDGNYWCAMYEGGRIVKLSPAGDIVATIEVPMASPTMPCFGGEGLRTLFVTGAKACVIATQVDVPGLPVNFVKT